MKFLKTKKVARHENVSNKKNKLPFKHYMRSKSNFIQKEKKIKNIQLISKFKIPLIDFEYEWLKIETFSCAVWFATRIATQQSDNGRPLKMLSTVCNLYLTSCFVLFIAQMSVYGREQKYMHTRRKMIHWESIMSKSENGKTKKSWKYGATASKTAVKLHKLIMYICTFQMER